MCPEFTQRHRDRQMCQRLLPTGDRRSTRPLVGGRCCDLGPSINTPELLGLVDDKFLRDAIVQGRPGTGMPAWRHLESQDVEALIRYIHTWQTSPSRTLPPLTVQGDPEAGGLLFERTCSSCHGHNADGGSGPQLGNPVFLRS
ncbi:MAG: hypothetical protein HY343_02155, partial [Lentisphaerae bacterium]|nr:hypothetical protein [Lentisphaerota bacterium]